MGARYVYFRDSTGRPYRGTDGKYAPVNLLADLGKSSVLQENGRIGWQGGWPDDFEPLLSFFVVVGRDGVELNDPDAKKIVWRALEDVAKRALRQPLKLADVIPAADKRADEFYRQPTSNYVLVASLSIKNFPARKILIRGRAITPMRSREPRYPLPKVLRTAQHKDTYAEHFENTRYQLVKVDTEGRTVFEAVGQALDDLSLLRAIWSFTATLGQGSVWSWGTKRKPIGIIHTAPVYTLHLPDGSAANEEYFWFDPGYSGDQPLFDPDGRSPRSPDSGWARIEKNRRWAMRRISRLPYRSDVERLLLRYIAALDEPNPNVALLQLWGILEATTNTVEARYDETIRRASWVFVKSERPLMREVLESLRHHRNRYVHSGSAGQVSQEIAYRIKSIVDPHLIRLLNNTFHVANLREYGEFLSYPTEAAELEKIRRWVGRALRAAREEETDAPASP
jgi:hypothetical protein